MSSSLHSRAVLPQQRSLAAPMLFAALATDVQAQLRAASPPRRHTDGQIIQQRGTRADGFSLIEEGAVRVGVFLPEGEFRAVAVLGPGDSYGELAVFAGTPRVVDAVSRGDSVVRFIAARPFLEAVEGSPTSTRALLAALSAQLQDTLGLLPGCGAGPTLHGWRVCWRILPAIGARSPLPSRNLPNCSASHAPPPMPPCANLSRQVSSGAVIEPCRCPTRRRWHSSRCNDRSMPAERMSDAENRNWRRFPRVHL